MNILQVVHAYPPSRGGSQWLTAQLGEQLVRRHGDQVTVFTTVARNIEYFWGADDAALPVGQTTINGVQVRRFPVFRRFNRLRWLAAGVAYRLRLPYHDWLRTLQTGPIIGGLRSAIAQSGADVVFATAFPLLHMYDAIAGARRGGLPVVLLGALHLADPWGYDRAMIYQAIRQADAYLAHTSYERDHLVNQKGIDASKIWVVGGGVEAERFRQANGRALRQRWGWGDAPVIAVVGKHVARKRFDLMLAAMPAVWARHPQTQLVLAGGRTAYTAEIEQMVHQLPGEQQKQVTIWPDFAEDEKPALLAACDLFVLPSGHESFGIAFVEAWAAGKAVIGASSGAIPSVIQAGVDGLLFDYPNVASLAQSIITLLDQPLQRQAIGAAGQHKVDQRYTWAVVAEQIRNVFEQVRR